MLSDIWKSRRYMFCPEPNIVGSILEYFQMIVMVVVKPIHSEKNLRKDQDKTENINCKF